MNRRSFVGWLSSLVVLPRFLKIESPPKKESIRELWDKTPIVFTAPPIPDSVALRGTPEWREAFNAHRAWIENQLKIHGTL